MRMRLGSEVIKRGWRQPSNAAPMGIAAADVIAVVLAVLGDRAFSAQDKYTVQVPGGLALSESGDTRTGRLSPSVIPKTSSS